MFARAVIVAHQDFSYHENKQGPQIQLGRLLALNMHARLLGQPASSVIRAVRLIDEVHQIHLLQVVRDVGRAFHPGAKTPALTYTTWMALARMAQLAGHQRLPAPPYWSAAAAPRRPASLSTRG